MSGRERPILRLVRSRKEHALIGTVRLGITSARNAPSCDAVVLEEDTWQILAAGPESVLYREHPIRLWTGLLDAKPLAPGTVMQREGQPLTMVAVVYDFDDLPCCRSRWVAAALADIFRICRERHVRSLLLPLPGVRHGRFTVQEAFRLVVAAIREVTHGDLRRVLLRCPSVDEEAICSLLSAES